MHGSQRPFHLGWLTAALLSALALCAAPTATHAQSACAQLGVDCSHPSDSGHSSGSESGTSGGGLIYRLLTPNRDPTKKADYVAWKRGKEAYEKGDFLSAEKFFRQSLALEPDANVTGWLVNTQYRLSEDWGLERFRRTQYLRAAVENRRLLPNTMTWVASLDMLQRELAGIEAELNDGARIQKALATPGAATPPGAPQAAPQAERLEFSTKGSAFGARVVSNPDLGAAGPASEVKVDSAMQQLGSMAHSSADATTGAKIEDQRELAECGTSRANCRGAAPDVATVTPPGGSGYERLAARVPPAVAGNPLVKGYLAQFRSFESQRDEKQRQLDAVQRQLADHSGDAVYLTLRQQALQADVKVIDHDVKASQEGLVRTIKDLGIVWDEAPEATSGAGDVSAGITPAPAQP